MKSISKIILLLFTVILLHSCAKQNAGIVKQTYHDLTSHYNGYFNANEAFNIQLRSLQKNRRENYEEILPIFAYGSLDEIKDQNSGLSTSIQKARLTIQTHQEKFEGKHYNANEDNSISNWSDDAFLLIGKSYYLQGELDSAISCFRYITANFDEAVDARSKKKIKKQKSNKKAKAKAKKKEDKQIELEKKGKDIRPSKKFTLHESTKSEALVWLSNAYISQGDYGKAEAILTYIQGDKTFLKNYDKDVALSQAYLNLAQGNHSNAEKFITTTIEESKNKKEKARLQFILGQIAEKNGDNSKAAVHYKNSIKGNNNFEMIFYAKLKMIQMNRKSETDSKETMKLIAKMTKDNKNREYYDQLYYEKALLSLNEDEREDAKKYLLKSIDVSTSNTKQKGISYIQLADLNYEEEAYAPAQAYYDSALLFIDETYFAYNQVSTRSEVLDDLIDNLNTIATNDSLLVLGAMPAKELESMLYKKAVDIVDAEIKAAAKSKQNNVTAISASAVNKTDKNAWYFYSEASKNSGYKKFKQTWGEIVLEDNWRRSEKNSSSASDEDYVAEEEVAYFDQIDNKYQEMLQAVPNSEAGKTALKNDIISGYYNAAVIYKVGLENDPKSIEMFEALNAKYPKNKFEPEALYQLYILHKNNNETAKADEVKKELYAKYPNNKYTEFIKNPSKLQTNSQQDVSSFYEKTYDLYLAEDYDAVIFNCETANENYTNSKLLAKFDLLKAMAIGGKKLYEPFVASLEYVVETHKATEEQQKASELLAALKGENTQNNATKIDAKSKLIKGDVKGINTEIDVKSLPKESNTIDNNDGGVKLKLGNKEINIGGKRDALDSPVEKEVE